VPSALPDRRPAADPREGVFETLLARDGRIQALGAHLGRLARSAYELYGASMPPGLSGELRGRVHALAGERRLRVDGRPGDAGLRIEVQSSELPPNRHALVRCRVVEVPGGLGRHKLADRRRLEALGPVADTGAGPRAGGGPAGAGGPGGGGSGLGAGNGAGGGFTVLIADRGGELLEAAWGNLWLIDGRRLVTPPADGRLLPGITRRLLLQTARALGLETREEAISVDRARAAQAVLLTSSLRHCVAAQLDGGAADAGGAEAEAARIRAALRRVAWE
jgi:para-aminobenzoate synthetase/4-amino-4-deoxychorismate lyase